VLTGRRSERSVGERQGRARRSEADIVQVVAALVVALLVLVVVVEAVLAACMGVASIAGWAMDHMQILGQHHSVGSEVLYRRTAAAVAVAAAAGNSGTNPGAEIGALIEKLRVTDDFRGLQSAA